MAEKDSAGQADKAAAERRTAQVGADNRAEETRAASTRSAAPSRDADKGEALGAEAKHAERMRTVARKQADPAGVEQPFADVKGGAEGETAAERLLNAEDVTSPLSVEIVDPFPAYEGKTLDQLRSLAKSRKVEINRDVEKAHLVAALRDKDPHPAWDFMTLDELRAKVDGEDGVETDGEWEMSQLISELRAADTLTR